LLGCGRHLFQESNEGFTYVPINWEEKVS
jgi:hypothetical protein